MIENVGRKIKALAIISFFISCVGVILTMAILMAANEIEEWLGLIVIIATPIIAWISAVFVYGLGQLIENSDIMAADVLAKNPNLRTAFYRESSLPESDDSEKIKEIIREKKEAKKQKASDNKNAEVEIKNSDVIDDAKNVDDDPEYYDFICPECKHLLSYTLEEIQGDEQLVCPMCNSSISFNDIP